jgi:integrase
MATVGVFEGGGRAWSAAAVVRAAGMAQRRSLRTELRARGLSARTADIYEGEVFRVQRFLEQQRATTLAACSAEDLEAYVATKRRSSSSYAQTRYALGHYWSIHRRRRPPLWAIPRLRRPDYQSRALEPADADRLEATARAVGGRKGLVVLLGLYGGLRREEISWLRWDDFAGDGFVRVLGKGGKTRWVFVHPVLAAALVEARAVADAGEFVFAGRAPRACICPATVWLWCRQVADVAGVELAGDTVPPHRLRHTNLTEMNDATGDLRATQEHAGHSRPEVTARYTRTRRRQLRAAVLSLRYGEPRADV